MSNEITFNIQQGGLGRRLPGLDYVSALVMPFIAANLPAGFGVNDRIKKVSSLDEAIALGITKDGAGNGKILYYHIKEFFRIFDRKTQSIGDLWLNLYLDTAGLTEADITGPQEAANGEIRQMAVYPDLPFAASLLTTVTPAVNQLLNEKMPLVLIMGGDFSGFADVSALADIRALNNPFISVDVSQDGSGDGLALFTSEGKSINGLGTVLGTIAASTVSQNIGWVREFDIADAIEYQEPALGNGQIDLSAADITSLEAKGYIFARKRRGVTGAYYNDSPQAVSADNDFAFIENSRTIQKAIRVINSQILPFQNAPLFVNATTGKLNEDTIFELESACFDGLNVMARDFEINVDSDTGRLPNNSVFIDPDQNVLSTSKVNIVVRIVPVGVQRETVINIGFTPKINTGV